MLKRLLVPTLVLTVAGLLGAGCHDDSGNGTNKPSPTGMGGTSGSDAEAMMDAAAGSDGADASDAATDTAAPDTAAADSGGDTADGADATGN